MTLLRDAGFTTTEGGVISGKAAEDGPKKIFAKPVTDKELREGGPPEVYDNTMLAQWCKCPRLLYWFMRRLSSSEDAPYFAFGKAWGIGMNYWHSNQETMSPDERYEGAIDEMEKLWEAEAPIEQGDNNYANLIEMFSLYRQLYGDFEEWTYPYQKGELGFTVPLPGTSVSYGGAIDAPIQWKNYGIFFREDKTTGGYITEGYLNQWDHAAQVAGYIMAFEDILGAKIEGGLMNIASKKKRKKGDEALRFSRPMVKRSPELQARFKKTTVLTIDDIRREWERWEWPCLGERDPINCAGGMGRSACVYRRICLSGVEPWELPDDFDFGPTFKWKGPWAPWDRVEKAED